MTTHHDSGSTRASRVPKKRLRNSTSPQKPPDSLQWDLDQELQDHVSRVRQIMSTSPPNPLSRKIGGVGVGVGVPQPITDDKENDRDSTPTHTHPPIVPPLSPSLERQEQLCQTFEWLKTHRITCINYILRKHTPEEIAGAIEDYEAALQSGYVIHSPTGFFRRLLEPVSPDRKQPQPSAGNIEDPEKYTRGKYGHMVISSKEDFESLLET